MELDVKVAASSANVKRKRDTDDTVMSVSSLLLPIRDSNDRKRMEADGFEVIDDDDQDKLDNLIYNVRIPKGWSVRIVDAANTAFCDEKGKARWQSFMYRPGKGQAKTGFVFRLDNPCPMCMEYGKRNPECLKCPTE